MNGFHDLSVTRQPAAMAAVPGSEVAGTTFGWCQHGSMKIVAPMRLPDARPPEASVSEIPRSMRVSYPREGNRSCRVPPGQELVREVPFVGGCSVIDHPCNCTMGRDGMEHMEPHIPAHAGTASLVYRISQPPSPATTTVPRHHARCVQHLIAALGIDRLRQTQRDLLNPRAILAHRSVVLTPSGRRSPLGDTVGKAARRTRCTSA